MKFMNLFASAALMAGLASPAMATDLIPYPNSGNYNATTYSFVAAADTDVVAYIVGGFGAGYTNQLGLLVNGVLSSAGYGLGNHSSSVGDSFNFGAVKAGDQLVFVLHNVTLGADAYSDPSLNGSYDDPAWTGGNNHIYSTDYTATSPLFAGVPSGTYVAFEDLPFGGSDFNYDDESFVFQNVRIAPPTAAVPEPATWAMMLAGFGAVGMAARRRKTRVAVSFA
jgi:hypothetical protein